MCKYVRMQLHIAKKCRGVTHTLPPYFSPALLGHLLSITKQGDMLLCGSVAPLKITRLTSA